MLDYDKYNICILNLVLSYIILYEMPITNEPFSLKKKMSQRRSDSCVLLDMRLFEYGSSKLNEPRYIAI